MQLPLFDVSSTWTPPSLGSLPRWEGCPRVCVDVETRDPHLTTLGPGVRRGAYVVGIGFALEGAGSYYLPIRHEAGGNVDEEQAWSYLCDQTNAYTGTIVGANLQYDLDFLLEEGVSFPNVQWFRDVELAAPLLNELLFTYSLNAIAERMGFPGKDETLLRQAASNYGLDPKKDLWKLHSKYVGPYAQQDVCLPLRILAQQEPQLEEEGLWDVYNLESRLLPALVRMKRRGICVDLDHMEIVRQWSLKEESHALAVVKEKTGYDIGLDNVWKPEALVKPLRYIGLEVPLTPKTKKPSIDKEFLGRHEHPVCQALARARKVNKIRTTFIESVKRHLTKGRIHCNLNQLRREKEDGTQAGAAFGRMSSDNPNMQQQPSPAGDKEVGNFWRKIFIADPGAIWACNDFSQQEPRWTVHKAEECHLAKADMAGEKYRRNPKTDNHQMMADLAKIPRDPAKKVFLGLVYGMGGVTLCHRLGLPTKMIPHWRDGHLYEVPGDEGQAILDKFDAEVPFVRQLANEAKVCARTHGYVRTFSGRKCRFPQTADNKYDWIHKALNRYVQGSSGDQMKQAIIDADAQHYYIQLPVHDELNSSVASPTEARILGQVMVDCVPLRVPMMVDVEIGPSWGEIMSIEKYEEAA